MSAALPRSSASLSARNSRAQRRGRGNFDLGLRGQCLLGKETGSSQFQKTCLSSLGLISKVTLWSLAHLKTCEVSYS